MAPAVMTTLMKAAMTIGMKTTMIVVMQTDMKALKSALNFALMNVIQ